MKAVIVKISSKQQNLILYVLHEIRTSKLPQPSTTTFREEKNVSESTIAATPSSSSKSLIVFTFVWSAGQNKKWQNMKTIMLA